MLDRSILLILLASGLSLTSVGPSTFLPAQESAASTEGGDAVSRLDQLTRRTESYLHSLPALEVEVVQSWTLEGQSPRKGRSVFSLRANHDGPFRLEIRSGQDPPVTVTCVGDGKQITRTFDDGTRRLVAREAGSFHDLAADQLTASCLAGSGLDILCRPEFSDHVMSRASQVDYIGTADLPQGRSHHFRCSWDRESELELWISADEPPLLLRQIRTLSTEDDPNQTMVISTDYRWNRRDPWPASTFQVDTGNDFVKVTDLYTYLLEGAARESIGQTAPDIALSDTAGQQHKLKQSGGQKVVCLFFWTTWATASTVQKAEVYRLMDEFRDDPVVFYAVNVGESKETVSAFVERTGFTGTVLLDENQELVGTLRITSLPVCVLVGKDGKIAAVHLGNTAEDRELVRRDLAELAGRPLRAGEQ